MTFSDPDPQEVEDTEEESPKGLRQQLAKQGAELQRLQKELADRDRDLAFTRVGLPATPMAEFFRSNYTGDPSEEAIRAQAAELGLIGSPSAETSQQVDEINEMSEAASGGGFVMPADRMAEMHAAMRAVPPGPFAAKQIEQISQQYGMPTALDDT